MRKLIRAVLTCLALIPVPALAQTAAAEPPADEVEVIDSSYEAPGGGRVLTQSLVIPAAQDQVWEAWTTTQGLTSWAFPVGRVDFRVGGIWESSYDPKARLGDPGNILNRVVAFIPGRMLAFLVDRAPPGFPHPEVMRQVVTVVELEPVAEDATMVTVTMAGWGAGPENEKVFGFFTQGNAWTLKKLHERFTKGPVDWPAYFAAQARKAG